MARELVSDKLWSIVDPLIPKVERRYRSRAVSGSTTGRC